MHAVIEFLPVLFGLMIAGIDRRLKPVFFAHDGSLFLCLMAGTFVNWLSGEGVEFVILDMATTVASAVAIVVLRKVVRV